VTSASSPRVSVVLPAYYSDATIGDFLDGLRAQTFRDFEAIVINSSPEERTAEIVSDRMPEATFEQAPHRLLPHGARNRGVELARGSLIVFSDPDCVPDRDWLAHLVRASDRGRAIVVGAMDVIGHGRYVDTVHLCKYARWLPGGPAGPRAIAPTANALYTRDAWNSIGALRSGSFSSDTLQSWLAAERGFQVWFEPGAVVAHHHGGNLRSFYRERRIRGEDFARLRVLHENRSRTWGVGRLVSLPLIPWLELARVGRAASRAGWGRRFVQTMPLQLAANTAWALGEAKAHVRLALRGSGQG
jgi:GT2 family glycosyltransferase